MDRRLPVYLLIDVSGSMQGQPIESVNAALELMKFALETDPYALETVHLSVITFSSGATQLSPLTELPYWSVPVLRASGSNDFIAGLELLLNCVQSEVTGSDWRPVVMIFSSGAADCGPSTELTARFKSERWGRCAGFICAQDANDAPLRHLVETVYSLSSIDAVTMKQLVLGPVEKESRSQPYRDPGADLLELPDLPQPPWRYFDDCDLD
jgi:uncharacterized protein YegL